MSQKKLIDSIPFFLPILLLVYVWWWILGAISPIPTNYADSLDLIMAAKLNGLAHPPGYLMLVGFLRLVFLIFPNFNPYYLASVVNAGLVSIGLIFIMISLMTSKAVSRWRGSIISIILVTVFFSHPLLYKLTLQTEVMGWSIMMIGVWYWLVNHKRDDLIEISLFGWSILMVWHHLMLMPFLLISIYVSYMRTQSIGWVLKKLAIGVALITMVILGLTKFQPIGNEYSWTKPENIGGWFNFFLRSNYDKGVTAVDVFWRVSIQRLMVSDWYWLIEFGSMPQIYLVMIGFSFWVVVKKKFYHYWWLGLFPIFFGMLLIHPKTLGLSPLPYALTMAQLERLWYPIWLGILLLIVKLLEGIDWQPYRRKIFLVSLLIFSLISMTRNMASINLSQANAATVLVDKIFASLPEKSVLISGSDLYFHFLARQLLDNKRSDLTILSDSLKLTRQSDEFILDMIVGKSIEGDRKVYFEGLDQAVLNKIIARDSNIRLIPFGYVVEISKNKDYQSYQQDYGLSVQLTNVAKTKDDWWFRWFKEKLSIMHAINMYYASLLKDDGLASFNKNMAQSLAGDESTRQQIETVYNDSKAL